MSEHIDGFGEIPELGKQGTLIPAPHSMLAVHSDVENPVAHVQVLLPQPHLDHIFDFEVPADLADTALPGTRVEVVIGANPRVQGFLISRDGATRSAAQLRPLRRVVSPVPALAPEIWDLAREVSARWASSVPDVLRLAVPARHARAEKTVEAEPRPDFRAVPPPAANALEHYVGGAEFYRQLEAGGAPRAVLAALPGPYGTAGVLLAAVTGALRSGRAAIVVVPTTREARAWAARLESDLGESVAVMVSEDTPADRYAAFQRVREGKRRVVVGTRAAVWAPAVSLGLAVVVDDASPQLREQRAPYAHARDVLALRTEMAGAAFLVVSPYVSVESAALVPERAQLLEAPATERRAAVPAVSSPVQWRGGEQERARIPSAAFTVIRSALERGPVLAVIPRAGYLPYVVCANCGAEATCRVCGGPLSIEGPGGPLACRRCGADQREFRCAVCGSGRVRAARVGSARTAEEFGRAFPGVGIVVSSASSSDGIVAEVAPAPRIVVATPGAEPNVRGGYAASVVLDARLLAGRDLDAETEFVRRLARIAVRTRPAREGGHVLIAGGVPDALVTLLNSWEHGQRAASNLAERASLHLPPAWTWLAISGERESVRSYLGLLRRALREASSALPPADADPPPGADQPNGTGNETPGTDVPLDALLVGGVHLLAAGVEVLGPVPARREGEITMSLRAEPAAGRLLTATAWRAYREHTGAGGSALRLEVNPPM